MNTYPLDQNPIPQAPMTTDQRHRFVNVSIIAIAVALIMAILYWWTTSDQSGVTVTGTQNDVRAQVAAILREAPVQATPQEIENVASRLSSSKAAVTEADRQAVANALQNQNK